MSFDRLIWVGFLAALLCGCQPMDSAEQTWIHDETGLFSAAFSANGQYEIVAPTKGPARFIDVANNRVLYQWQHTDQNDGVVAAAIADNLRYAVTAETHSLALWRIKDGKIIGYWDFPAITDLAITGNGKYALVGLEDNKAYFFDLFKGRIIYTFQHTGRVNTVALAKRAPLAMTGGSGHKAKLWDLNSGRMLREWDHPFKVYKVLLSEDGSLALTNASMNKARIWNTSDGQLLNTLPMRYITVTSGAFSPDNRLLATGRPNYRVDLWDVKTSKRVHMWTPKKKHFWRPDSAAIIDLAFETGGKTIVSEASNGIAHRWRVP